MNQWIKWCLALFVISLLLTYIVIPWAAQLFSGFRIRATKLSPISARGLEWYQKSNKSTLPTLRIERIHWSWGGCTLGSSITLNIEGVTIRVRKSPARKHPKAPKKKKKIPDSLQRLFNYLFHFVVLNWSTLATYFAIRIVDIKVILEDLQDVELTVNTIRLGVTREHLQAPYAPSLNPDEEAPQLHSSPPMSPSVDSGYEPTMPQVPKRSPNARRMANIHRRATSIHTTMSKTASHIWTHAIGSAIDRVTVCLNISDIAVLLPRSTDPMAASTSLPHLSQKSSNGSLKQASTRSATFDPIVSLLKMRQYTPLGVDEGYEKLFVVENQSTITACIGFGPNLPFLAHDNLHTTADIGTLHLSLDGAEKLQQLAKLRPRRAPPPPTTEDEQPRRSNSPWDPAGLPRAVLRASKFASVSLTKVYVSHLLPVATPPLSTASSATELSADTGPAERPYHTMSLDFTNISFRVEGTHSGKNSQLATVFGTNKSPQSVVRGITAKLQWTAIELQCIGPGETSNDKTQLVAIRRSEFDFLTTWRPTGWHWDDLLFSDDPNLSLAMARGYVSSIDIAGDLQLVGELQRAWSQHRPSKPRPPREPKAHRGLPPRTRALLDVGPVSIILGNRASKDSATVTLATDGLTVGCHSSYSNLPPPKPAASKQSTQEEVMPFTDSPEGSILSAPSVAPSVSSSAQATINTDGQSEPAGETETLKSAANSEAGDHQSEPDPAAPVRVSLRGDAYVSLEPVSLRMSVGSRNEKTYRVATLGKVDTVASGDVWGSEQIDADGHELYTLMPETLSSNVEVTCETGLRMELWHPRVIDAIGQLASMKEPSAPKPPSNPLDKLPTGVTLRLALGMISVFVGHQDPNPKCDLGLVHGLWFQTKAVFNYARYKSTAHKSCCRHVSHEGPRAHFSLLEDLTAKAYDYAEHLKDQGGDAALFTVLVRDAYVRPVFNGASFVAKGGVDRVMLPDPPRQRQQPDMEDDYVGWGRKPPPNPAPKRSHTSNQGGLESRSFIRLPYSYFTGSIRRTRPDACAEYSVQSRIERVHVDGYISDIYCTLLAAKTFSKISKSFKKSAVQAKPVKVSRPLAFSVLVPAVWLHFTFPLKEEIFISLAHAGIDKPLDKVMAFSSDHVLFHVHSAMHPEMWDEMGLIKKLNVALDTPNAIMAKAAGMRIRIPHAFYLSQLILNINVFFKAFKLLSGNLKEGVFHTVKMPVDEPPKHVPNMTIQVDLLHLEARDNPVENKINLANRVGLIEQRSRLQLEDMFEHKLNLLNDPDTRPVNHLTTNATVDAVEARYRLDWHISRNWIKRIRRAREYERRREEAFHNKMSIRRDSKLPIPVLPLEQTTPLFRAAFSSVTVKLSPPALDRSEIINYMGKVSAPFANDVGFTLMVPFEFDWSMGETKVSLRDYPLPVLRIEPTKNKGPSWRVTTLFVIAEELAGDDSCLFIPCQVLPAATGDPKAKPLWVQIVKTINPVKTYARPMIKIYAPEATKITWSNSYSAGYSEFSRVIDKLSSPPRDPSPKLGFWDKMRLVLHWRVRMDFEGSVRFYLKGSHDPYLVTGYGSGFALVLRRNVRIEVCQPNKERETVQFMADELLVSIPDLAYLHDAAAVGVDADLRDTNEADRLVIERRSIKPCARFMNGVRFGLGFKFERTCRPWTCHACGETDSLLHRQCRIFEFRPHNTVVLRSPEAIEAWEAQAGHAVDSYEAFRSDYIHFSVSLVAPREHEGQTPRDSTAETHNSLHLNPKAFAHFFSWWGLFSSKLPAPIRTGPLFSDTPPPSKKFGRSMATIKYRMDLAPVYLSHMYNQVSEELWAQGREQSLGLKLRVRRLRVDCHQRMQEKRQWNKELGVLQVITHKPFYANDILLDQLQIVGIVADFDETHLAPVDVEQPEIKLPKASELPPGQREWFNSFDFIDADRKPFDRDPRVEIVDIGDCPHVFLSSRVKARATMPEMDDESYTNDVEASKFGHEKTHVCYLGAAIGIGPMQQQIAESRIEELEEMLDHLPPATAQDLRNPRDVRQTINHRINTLRHHIDDLAHRERRHMDDDTLQRHEGEENDSGEVTFQNTLHVHCPRLFINNRSRNLLYKYNSSFKNRRKEEYTVSHASLRGIRDGIHRRLLRSQNGLNRDDLHADLQGVESGNVLLSTLEGLIANNPASRFKLMPGFYSDNTDNAHVALGIPTECKIHPHWKAIVLKPQIALRSSADPDAVVLIAVEEVSFGGFAVRDPAALDEVAMNVLSRNYTALRGLQAFYPTKEVLQRSPGDRQVDFVPLEVFLDVRSETTEYERIVLKTDMSLHMDEFNDLRVPRGLEWPKATNEYGEPIQHLRRHQNMTAIVIPMVTVSATPTHYSALYYLITDLLMYKDPQTAVLSEKINSFMYKFDQRDRDPQQLLMTLFVMQQHIRNLAELQRGYQANVTRLTEEGKVELFRIRTDLLHESESLLTIFEVINANRARDDAQANARTLSRLDVRAGNVAWHMLRDNGDPLIKLNIKHAIGLLEHNQDGSSDSAMVIGDMQALNSNADAVFPEVISRYDKDWSKDKKHPKSNTFLSVVLCLFPQVGGIGIVRQFALYVFPVRFRLEQEVGSALVDYIFNDKTGRPPKLLDSSKSKPPAPQREDSLTVPGDSSGFTVSRNGSEMALPQVTTNGRGRSATVATMATVSTASEASSRSAPLESVPDLDAAEMRRRATSNRTFISVIIGSTIFVLDYKRDDKRKHSGIQWPECVDFRLHSPQLEYHDEILTFKELFDKVKVDIRSYALSQTGNLLGQVFKKTSVFRSKKSLRQVAGITAEIPTWNPKKGSPKSPLRFTVQPATPLEMDELGNGHPSTQIAGTPTGAIFRTLSRRSDGAQSPARISHTSSSGDQHGDDGETESPPLDKHHRRGLMDRLRKSTKQDDMEYFDDSVMPPASPPERSASREYSTSNRSKSRNTSTHSGSSDQRVPNPSPERP